MNTLAYKFGAFAGTKSENKGWGYASTNAFIDEENNTLASVVLTGSALLGTVGGNSLSKIKSNKKVFIELLIDNAGNDGSGLGFHNTVSETLGSNWARFHISGGRIYLGINSNTLQYNIDAAGGGSFYSGWAIDTINNRVWVKLNDGSWLGGGDPVLNTSPTFSLNMTNWTPYGEGFSISTGFHEGAQANIYYGPSFVFNTIPSGYEIFT